MINWKIAEYNAMLVHSWIAFEFNIYRKYKYIQIQKNVYGERGIKKLDNKTNHLLKLPSVIFKFY